MVAPSEPDIDDSLRGPNGRTVRKAERLNDEGVAWADSSLLTYWSGRPGDAARASVAQLDRAAAF